MGTLKHRFSSNTGLLDARGTAQVLCSLSARFSAVEFADYCTIAEQVVLRDQIIIVGKRDRLSRAQALALKPFFDAGIFVSLDEAFKIPELASDPRQLRATISAIERGLTTATVEDATFEARRVLGGEAHFGIPATPLLRQLQHFGLVRRPCIENTVWDLAAQYRRLSDIAAEIRRHYQAMAALPQVAIPPIALRAIQRSKTFEQIVFEIFELRKEFTPLRTHLREIEDRLREGRLSPTDALELEKTWRERWVRIADRLQCSSRLALARTSLPLLKEGAKIAMAVIMQDAKEAVAATFGLLSAGMDTLEDVDVLGTLQVRPVHRSVSNFLSASDQDLVRSVARIFETDFVRLDGDMRALAYQPGSPWRLAVDGHQTQTAQNAPQKQARPQWPAPTRQRFDLPQGNHSSIRQPVSNSNRKPPGWSSL
ncbi:hypothetical protein [Hyphomicrobium sp.]|uniref:hypothetical protein n=1 Tax=Hyphomicrobium sp. TaxID=82 RepID=UPI001E1A227C|nr:hypothetical protein [Hyphomicrobium sp.]MBY0561971.1 hypothetical protein [Hyphomicrobium sp.]